MSAAPARTAPASASTPGTLRRVFMMTFAGVLLMQLAWILTLPAFGGMDEFDHAFRAASVARGEVVGGGPTAHGRGGQVVVPADLARAASRMCASYDYTGRDNCHPVKSNHDGTVVIDSAASSYNPVYYAVAGTLSRPFHGASTDVAARCVTAMMAAALLAWAVVVTRRRTRSKWPFLALMVVTTPTLVYSSAVTSPNGVGYAAAALVWSTALAFVASDRPPPLLAFTVGSVALLVTHSTNLVWLVLIAATVLMLRSRAYWLGWIGSHRGGVLRSGAVVLATALASAAWILVQKTNHVDVDDSLTRHYWPSVPALVGQWAVWCLQTIGAFPLRDQPAPLIAYVMWLVPFVALMVAGWRAADRRLRLAMTLVALAWLLVPTVATVRTYELIGFAWQGRYALPLAAGLPLLAAFALSARGREPRRMTVRGTLALCVLAQALCVTAVAAHSYRSEFAPSVVPGAAGAITAAVLALLGGWSLALGLTWRLTPPGEVGRAATPDTVETSRVVAPPATDPVGAK